jgi:hypothetical protein
VLEDLPWAQGQALPSASRGPNLLKTPLACCMLLPDLKCFPAVYAFKFPFLAHQSFKLQYPLVIQHNCGTWLIFIDAMMISTGTKSPFSKWCLGGTHHSTGDECLRNSGCRLLEQGILWHVAWGKMICEVGYESIYTIYIMYVYVCNVYLYNVYLLQCI